LEVRVQIGFIITQHSRDEYLMRSLIDYLGCGYYSARTGKELGQFEVKSLKDILEKILPFFQKHPVKGVKFKDFED